MIVKSIDGVHVLTEFNNIILFLLSITLAMVDLHCEILWDNN